MLRAIGLLFIIFAAMPLSVAVAVEAVPAPFKATYSVSYRGVNAGQLHVELRQETDGRLTYENRISPGFLASMLVSRKAVERSTMRIDAGGVRPLHWLLDDGKPGQDDDGELQFSWDKQRVRGTVDGKPLDVPIEAGMQDRLSFQIAAMTALLRGQEPGTIPMIDKDRIKAYSYHRQKAEQIRTPGGRFDTVLYESTRPGSSRVSRIWHAPALGYLAVRFERLNKGKVETVMELVSVERSTVGQK